MSYNLTGVTVSGSYGRLVQVIHGTPDLYYDGFGNLLDLGLGTASVGPTGPTGPQGQSLSWMGDWDQAMMYFEYDLVSYQGSSYIYVSATPGATSAPPSTNTSDWDIFAYGSTASGGGEFYFQQSKPSPDPSNLGARWIDSDTGREYVWVYDGATYAWMQPTQLTSMRNTTGQISSATHSADFIYEYYGVTYMGGVCEVTLPLGTSEDEGRFIAIADEVGGISKWNRGIRVSGQSGQLINGNASVMMRMDWMSLTFMYRNSSWKTI